MSVTSKSTHTSQHLVLAHDRWFACGVQLAHLTCAFADAKRLLLRVYEAFMPGGWLKRVSWSACISALGGPCVSKNRNTPSALRCTHAAAMDGSLKIVTLPHLTDFTGKSINQHGEEGKGDSHYYTHRAKAKSH
jgi:hypothetical protein